MLYIINFSDESDHGSYSTTRDSTRVFIDSSRYPSFMVKNPDFSSDPGRSVGLKKINLVIFFKKKIPKKKIKKKFVLKCVLGPKNP